MIRHAQRSPGSAARPQPPLGFGQLLALRWLTLVLALLASGPARASQPADLCREAADLAASETGVPAHVLVAITLVETGRGQGGTLQPWPWTVNADGQGHWFPDRDSAIRFAEELLRDGRTSFDIGCFQINYRWHGDSFASITAIFDPVANARHAARFLAELARDRDGWSSAAGAYHSRTPDLAARYRTRFDAILADLISGMSPDTGPPRDTVSAEPRAARYEHPLLQARDAPRTPGSLVPLDQVPAT